MLVTWQCYTCISILIIYTYLIMFIYHHDDLLARFSWCFPERVAQVRAQPARASNRKRGVSWAESHTSVPSWYWVMDWWRLIIIYELSIWIIYIIYDTYFFFLNWTVVFSCFFPCFYFNGKHFSSHPIDMLRNSTYPLGCSHCICPVDCPTKRRCSFNGHGGHVKTLMS